MLVSPAIFAMVLVTSAKALAAGIRTTSVTVTIAPNPHKRLNPELWQVLVAQRSQARPILPLTNLKTGTPIERPISIDGASVDSNDPMSQVTSVSQLSDVQPTDWAFLALQSLVERYGCIAGYPDRTFKGNRVLTRYEFAAGLNACLERVNELIASSTALVRKEDVTQLQRLKTEFTPELASVQGRVDVLEVRTAQITANQFSTTSKLNGEAIFAIAGVAAGQNANGQRIDQRTIFADRVRLNFDTSFSGEDLLRVRLQALNLDAFSGETTLTPEGDFRFGGGTFANGNNNNVALDALLYSFPIGKSTTVVIEGNAGQPDDYTSTVNPYIDNDGTSGALSNFGTRNPIYNLLGGAGLGLRQELGEYLELSLGYIATTPTVSNPSASNGLFNGPYGAIAQLTVKPSKSFNFGLTYVNSYNNDLTAGSRRANLRSYLGSISAPVPPNPAGGNAGVAQPGSLAAFGGINLPVSSNSYGLEASYQVSPKFAINGWVGYTASRLLSTGGGVLHRGDLSILNYAVTLAFPDFGGQGSLAGIIFGMEPRVVGVSRSLRAQIGTDGDNSFHLEGFYQYKLNDNIAITPGIILITNPDFNRRNSDDIIGAIRTTFTF